MKSFMLLCMAALTGMALARPATYTDKYDSIDIPEILRNRRLLIPYLHCVLDKGKCTAEGRELKSHIKEALETHCELCTEAQKRGTRLVLGHLINKEKDYWQKLTAKYDPSGKYTKLYEDELTV